MGLLFAGEFACIYLGLRDTAAARDQVSYLPEERGLYKKMKVVDQLKYFAELKGVARSVADKKIAVFGFAFKKDTNDTRESAAINEAAGHGIVTGAPFAVRDAVVTLATGAGST